MILHLLKFLRLFAQSVQENTGQETGNEATGSDELTSVELYCIYHICLHKIIIITTLHTEWTVNLRFFDENREISFETWRFAKNAIYYDKVTKIGRRITLGRDEMRLFRPFPQIVSHHCQTKSRFVRTFHFIPWLVYCASPFLFLWSADRWLIQEQFDST